MNTRLSLRHCVCLYVGQHRVVQLFVTPCLHSIYIYMLVHFFGSLIYPLFLTCLKAADIRTNKICVNPSRRFIKKLCCRFAGPARTRLLACFPNLAEGLKNTWCGAPKLSSEHLMLWWEASGRFAGSRSPPRCKTSCLVMEMCTYFTSSFTQVFRVKAERRDRMGEWRRDKEEGHEKHRRHCEQMKEGRGDN